MAPGDREIMIAKIERVLARGLFERAEANAGARAHAPSVGEMARQIADAVGSAAPPRKEQH